MTSLENINRRFGLLKDVVVGLTALGGLGVEGLTVAYNLNVPTHLILLAFPLGVGLITYSRLNTSQRNSEISSLNDRFREFQNESSQSMNGPF